MPSIMRPAVIRFREYDRFEEIAYRICLSLEEFFSQWKRYYLFVIVIRGLIKGESLDLDERWASIRKFGSTFTVQFNTYSKLGIYSYRCLYFAKLSVTMSSDAKLFLVCRYTRSMDCFWNDEMRKHVTKNLNTFRDKSLMR